MTQQFQLRNTGGSFPVSTEVAESFYAIMPLTPIPLWPIPKYLIMEVLFPKAAIIF